MVNIQIQFLLLHLMVGLSFQNASDGKIKYEEVSQYREVWNDKGSGGSEDVSIWRLSNVPTGYCSLGEVGHSQYGSPIFKSIAVLYGPDVANPTGFTEIWNDKGSGAHKNCAIYSMNPPSGYTCVGSTAMEIYDIKPEMTNYCCIRETNVVPAGYTGRFYRDKRTGAHQDLSLWKGHATKKNGIEGHNMHAVGGYGKPNNVTLLNRQKVTKVVFTHQSFRINNVPSRVRLHINDVPAINEFYGQLPTNLYGF